MRRLAAIAAISLALSGAATPVCLAGPSTPGAEDSTDGDGFVPVDPSKLETVDGRKLATAAYSVIVGLILLYSLSLWSRERATHRRAQNVMLMISGTSKDASGSSAPREPDR